MVRDLLLRAALSLSLFSTQIDIFLLFLFIFSDLNLATPLSLHNHMSLLVDISFKDSLNLALQNWFG